MKELMDEIRDKFEIALQEKTGWGKDEVLRLYKDIASDVYLKRLAQMMDRNK
jgi:hypothetical protein